MPNATENLPNHPSKNKVYQGWETTTLCLDPYKQTETALAR